MDTAVLCKIPDSYSVKDDTVSSLKLADGYQVTLYAYRGRAGLACKTRRLQRWRLANAQTSFTVRSAKRKEQCLTTSTSR